MGANQSLGWGSVTLTAWSGTHLVRSTERPSWFGIWQTDQLAPPITHFPIACRLDSGVSGASGPGGPGGSTGLGAGDGVAVGVGEGAGGRNWTGGDGSGTGSWGTQMPFGQTIGETGPVAADPITGRRTRAPTAPTRAARRRLATGMGVLLEVAQLGRQLGGLRRLLACLRCWAGARAGVGELPVPADPLQDHRPGRPRLGRRKHALYAHQPEAPDADGGVTVVVGGETVGDRGVPDDDAHAVLRLGDRPRAAVDRSDGLLALLCEAGQDGRRGDHLLGDAV